MIISQENYKYACEIVKSLSGISLAEGKHYLLETRLMPLVKSKNYNNINELISYIKLSNSNDLITQMIELITTNESTFFRDKNSFDILKDKIIPNLLLQKPNKKINIWSAACSTGQEPYSIAMLLKENFPNQINQFHILASDINNSILQEAQKGVFSQFAVQRGLPISLLLKYFIKIDKSWRLQKDLINLVEFKRINLLDRFHFIEKFDIIFCKNVLIYFDSEHKMTTLTSLKKYLEFPGYLFLGSSETIMQTKHIFKIYDPKYTGIYSNI